MMCPILFTSSGTGEISCYTFVPKPVGKAIGLSAKEWLEQVVPLIGGKAGGSPEVAQCKGDKPDAVQQAIETGLAFVKGKTEK